MKTHLIIFTVAAGMISIAPLKANHITANCATKSFNGSEEDTKKAKDLSDKAFWMISNNTQNTDSLHGGITLCNQAIDLNPDFADAYYNRAYANSFLNNYAEALKDMDVAIAKRGDADDFETRGEYKFEMKDNDGALADFQTAAGKGYANDVIQALLGEIYANELGVAYYNLEQYDKAVTAFTIAINAEETKNNLFNRANAEYLNGDKAGALQDWKKSGKLGNKDGRKSYRKFR